ncbi:hypothetical protein LWI28_023419 [Acer negundo]|uniref:Uncharacterized protein n=1 Tax=Acer negundo TaxID=4023 RepID=A0AAD5P3Z8_ACENE|nr:hypothetical protein LWI28_023419 [Acer negundo]
MKPHSSPEDHRDFRTVKFFSKRRWLRLNTTFKTTINNHTTNTNSSSSSPKISETFTQSTVRFRCRQIITTQLFWRISLSILRTFLPFHVVGFAPGPVNATDGSDVCVGGRGYAMELWNYEAEVENINKRNMELEEKMEELTVEAGAWQQRARCNENMISALKFNLHQVYAQSRDSKEGCGDS